MALTMLDKKAAAEDRSEWPAEIKAEFDRESRAHNRCVGTDTLPVEGKRGAGGEWELVPNDVYLLRIRNEGEDAAYVWILDLTPDGRVEQLFPDREDLGDRHTACAPRPRRRGHRVRR